MKISDMIKQLQDAQAKYGDLPLSGDDGDYGHKEISYVSVMVAQHETLEERGDLLFIGYGEYALNPTHIHMTVS